MNIGVLVPNIVKAPVNVYTRLVVFLTQRTVRVRVYSNLFRYETEGKSREHDICSHEKRQINYDVKSIETRKTIIETTNFTEVRTTTSRRSQGLVLFRPYTEYLFCVHNQFEVSPYSMSQ